LVLAVGSNKQFHSLCSLLNIEGVYADVKYADNQTRVTHRDELALILQQAFAKNTRDYWMAELIAKGIPSGAIKSMDEVMTSTAAQTMIREEIIDGRPTKRISSIAFKLEL
jgi:crotonobetainyl-CoA:carnitine CoA-transferase CaiB-like acyl-CoA transferase